jgi:hypothetical protein
MRRFLLWARVATAKGSKESLQGRKAEFLAADLQSRIDDEQADASVYQHIGGVMHIPIEQVDCRIGQSLGKDLWAVMAHPNNILPPRNTLVLKRDLLQRIDCLSESLGKEGASHLFVRQCRLHMIERVQQVGLASRIALHHLQRLVAEHHEFGWRV